MFALQTVLAWALFATVPATPAPGPPRQGGGQGPPPPSGGPGGPPPGGAPSPPGGGGGGGLGDSTFGASASGCTVADGVDCELDGSNSFVDVSGLTYNANGKFTGKLKSNQCPKGAHFQPGGEKLTSTCTEGTFPQAGYENGPTAAPLRGTVGVTWSFNNIYGPFEAGFGNGMPEACTVDSVSSCIGGLDVPNCEAKVRKECLANSGTVKAQMMLDDCGGHAMPYHYHVAMRCEYDQNNLAEHSPIIGVAIDGYGIYGVWEGDSSFPALDACNGHYGWVPTNSTYGITRSRVYHYHVTPYHPYTIGCLGPVDSLQQCKGLFSTCDDGDAVSFDAQRADGTVYQVTDYDLDCPCVQHYSACETASLDGLKDVYQTLVSGFTYPEFNGTVSACTTMSTTLQGVMPMPMPDGAVPTPMSGPEPAPSPMSGPTPSPMSGPAPSPMSGPSPSLMSGPSPSPMSGPSPSPMSGPSPSSMSGPSPSPMSGPSPSTVSGSSPSPMSGPSPASGPSLASGPSPASGPAPTSGPSPVPSASQVSGSSPASLPSPMSGPSSSPESQPTPMSRPSPSPMSQPTPVSGPPPSPMTQPPTSGPLASGPSPSSGISPPSSSAPTSGPTSPPPMASPTGSPGPASGSPPPVSSTAPTSLPTASTPSSSPSSRPSPMSSPTGSGPAPAKSGAPPASSGTPSTASAPASMSAPSPTMSGPTPAPTPPPPPKLAPLATMVAEMDADAIKDPKVFAGVATACLKQAKKLLAGGGGCEVKVKKVTKGQFELAVLPVVGSSDEIALCKALGRTVVGIAVWDADRGFIRRLGKIFNRTTQLSASAGARRLGQNFDFETESEANSAEELSSAVSMSDPAAFTSALASELTSVAKEAGVTLSVSAPNPADVSPPVETASVQMAIVASEEELQAATVDVSKVQSSLADPSTATSLFADIAAETNSSSLVNVSSFVVDKCAGRTCNGKGACTDGLCSCSEGYTGANCGVPPPTTTSTTPTPVGGNAPQPVGGNAPQATPSAGSASPQANPASPSTSPTPPQAPATTPSPTPAPTPTATEAPLSHAAARSLWLVSACIVMLLS